jgi:hypothetical protein
MLTLAAIIFLAGLAPTLGLVSFIFQRHSTVADRYAYVALLGPAIAIGVAFQQSKLPGRVVVIICILALAIRCADQVGAWKNSLTLSVESVTRCPDSPMLHVNYGAALASTGKIEEADMEFIKALRLDSSNESALYNHRRAQTILTQRSSGRIESP